MIASHRGIGAAVAGVALACFTAVSAAQDKTRISFTAPASMAKYVTQHFIPVGDVPGHELRIFDLVRTFGPDGPLIAGVRLVEIRSVGYSDYTDLNGPAVSYNTWTLANGEKFFARTAIVSHNVGWSDPSKKGAENRTTGPITGGTGKLANLRGMTRNLSVFDSKTGTPTSHFDVEYWFAAQR